MNTLKSCKHSCLSALCIVVILTGCSNEQQQDFGSDKVKSEPTIAVNGNRSEYALPVEHTDSLASTPSPTPEETTIIRKPMTVRRAPVMRGGEQESPAPMPTEKVATAIPTDKKSDWNQPFKFNIKDTTFLLFTADTVMNMEETYDVFLSIYTDTKDSTKALKYFDSRDKHITRINDTLFYLPDYKVTLHGNGFRIVQVTDSVQHLYKHSVTTWNWQVIPQSGGTLKLTVVVAGFNAASEGTMAPKDHFFIRPIKVKVTGIHLVKEFAVSNYGYAAYTSILAGLGWYFQNRRKKSKQKASSESSEENEG